MLPGDPDLGPALLKGTFTSVSEGVGNMGTKLMPSL